MREWQVSSAVRLALVVAVAGSWAGMLALPARTQETGEVTASTDMEALNREEPISSSPPPLVSPSHLSELDQPAVTVEDWLAQIEASLVQITRVRLEETEAGLQIILETESGSLEASEAQSAGNALIVDIPNATLAEEFSQADPIAGIALVSVTELPDNRVRVAITGTDAPPVAEVRSGDRGLVLAVTLGDASAVTEEDAIQVTVTGEQEEDYYVPNASVGTRTETPLRDIPQSIQVIPQQVIEDQQATRLIEVLQNAPGIFQGGISPRLFSNAFSIRGFIASDNIIVNGLPDPTTQSVVFGENIERVEVLRGPASVLFGQGGLGGTVNLVTKQPLSEPFYALEASGGNSDFYRGAIDLSGSLNDSRTVLYRLTSSAQTTQSFIDFFEQQRYLVAPVLSWQISDRTNLTLEADFSAIEGPFDQGIPAEGSVLPNPNGEIPRDRFIGEPDDNSQNRVFRIGFDLDHRFSNNWQLRSVFRTSLLRLNREFVFSRFLQDDGRTLERGFDEQDFNENVYNLDTFIVGDFATGSIQHQLVAGINLFRRDTDLLDVGREIASLDLFDPEYGASPTDVETFVIEIDNRVEQLGFYIQDLISLTDNLKILLSGRFDIATQNFEDLAAETDDFSQEEEFSPRVGIVYQPVEPLSFYASYSRSFNQATSVFSAAVPEPEQGEQFEIGIKANPNDRLIATLAFYDLTRSNLPTVDPNNPALTIQVGEQRSRGIELDVSGEILLGWNIIAGYAYTDAEITEDNDFEVGNRLNNVPEHAFNIWTTYEIQSGDLQGLGFGLGIFFFGERQGDLANTFELPSYARTDAAIFYERANFRVALNIRNLFDTKFFVSAQNRNRVFSGEPLTVIGSISWEF